MSGDAWAFVICVGVLAILATFCLLSIFLSREKE